MSARQTFAACLGLALLACAPDQAAVDQPEPSPPLCALIGPEGAVEGWLLGTIHALPDGVEWRTPAIVRAIEAADYAMVEVAEPGGTATAAIFRDLARTPGLPPLPERVAPTLRGPLAALMDKAGVREGDFAATETWAAALTLAQAASQGSRRNSVDRAVIAGFAGRPVRELEGAAVQLGIFDALAIADQRALLEGIVREAGEAQVRQRALDRAWLTGDLAAIEAEASTGFLTDPQLREALLTRRNAAWSQRIAADLARPERPLIAVGAAHLPGQGGLIRLLGARGFECRTIT